MNLKWIVIGSTLTLAVVAGGAYIYQSRQAPDDIETGPVASYIPTRAVTTDPAGLNQLPSAAAGKAAETGNARGMVQQVYVRVAEGVLLDRAQATTEQRDGRQFAVVELAEPLGDGTLRVLALMDDDPASIGDVVDLSFAKRGVRDKNPFYRIERDRVTALVAKSGTQVAQDFQRRIAARGTSDPVNAPADPALWKNLPLDQAIKIVRGNGRRQMVVFSDPFCPASRAFEQILAQVDDVTLHVFATPVIRPDRAAVSKTVWCSPDRAKAWRDLAGSGIVPAGEAACDNPIDANVTLAQTIGLRATPTVIFADGARLQGSVPAATLRERLARAEAAAVAAAPAK